MRNFLFWVALVVCVEAGCHDLDALEPCPSGQVRINGACAQAASCTGIAESCGADHNDSCCASNRVDTSKEFRFGYSYGASTQEGEPVQGLQQLGDVKDVRLSTFWLDRYEITVARFRRFVKAYDAFRNLNPKDGDGAPAMRFDKAGGWDRTWKGNAEWVAPNAGEMLRRIESECSSVNGSVAPGMYTDAPGPNENKPMTCINWFEAMMFCIWDGARLPTEAEWAYAAEGGADYRAFPWSHPNDDTTVNDTLAVLFGHETLEDVGSRPKGASRFTQQDMAGNAYEWVLDSPASFTNVSTAQLTDPVDLSGYNPAGPSRIVRGGSFLFNAAYARTAYRRPAVAAQRYRDIGARCARPATATQ